MGARSAAFCTRSLALTSFSRTGPIFSSSMEMRKDGTASMVSAHSRMGSAASPRAPKSRLTASTLIVLSDEMSSDIGFAAMASIMGTRTSFAAPLRDSTTVRAEVMSWPTTGTKDTAVHRGEESLSAMSPERLAIC